MENIHQFACKPTLLHAFTNFIKIACFLFSIQIVFFFHTHPCFLFFNFVSLFLVGCLCVFIPNPCPVLEFELRKAKETIQALRANLTKAAGGVHKTFLRLFLLWQCRSSWDIFRCKIVKCYLYFLPPEHEVPLQERKNYKSSPEIQVGEWQT